MSSNKSMWIIFVVALATALALFFASTAGAASWSEIMKSKAKEVEVKGWFAPKEKLVTECYQIGTKWVRIDNKVVKVPVTRCEEK